MTSTSRSPQDPYASFLVAASAGSGKTYQLSRRFLHLVGAGARPGSILTVTFTKKAAGEMRARILEEAARLTVDTEAQARFAAEQRRFHGAAAAQGPALPPPRSAVDVGRAILAHSQSLTISTIDSLFVEWLRKFPYEASPAAELDLARAEAGEPGADDEDGERPGFPTPFTLIDPVEERELRELAWSATCRLLARGLRRGDEALTELLGSLPGQDVRAASTRVYALDRLETYLWYAERLADDGRALAPAPLASLNDLSSEVHDLAAGLEETSLLEQLTVPLGEIIKLISNDARREQAAHAVEARDLAGLVASGLITRSYTVSGNVVRGKKREQLAAEINAVEQLVRAHVNRQRLAELTRHGGALYDVYRIYRQLRDHVKFKRGCLEFRDLAKGAFRLFRGEAGLGARLLLARTVRHVMLDEFQDTSRLQWGIFAEMAVSMLAGDGVDDLDGGEAGTGPAPSVFIVGDVKQSIYGFREADPTVMTDAASVLRGRLELAPLTDSYRTAQVVLDYVNAVFAGGALADFPPHATAMVETEAGPQPFVPDVGRVMVAPLLGSGASDDEGADEGNDGDKQDNAEEREAELVADLIERALSQPAEFPVYDKGRSAFRPMRPGDVAILYRSTTKASLFEAALRRRGIPCQREEARGFFARPEILDAMALLRYLALPADVISLCTVLRSPLAGVPDELLIGLLEDTKAARHDVTRARAILAGVTQADPELGVILQSLADRADTVLPHALLAEALARLDAFGAYGRASLYRELHPEVAEATAVPLARRNLVGLVELLLKLEDDGITSLPAALRRLEALADADETGNAALDADTVTLMTIHKAKGLEFPLVAVVDAGRAWGRKDLHWLQTEDAEGRPSLAYIGQDEDRPVGDTDFDDLLAEAAQQIQDECYRLLYVALTRARQYLLISGHAPGRRVGLAETVLYEPLLAALDQGPVARLASEPLLVGKAPRRHPLRQWAVGTDTPVTVAAASTAKASDATKHLLDHVEARPGLPREIRVVSPSRHEVNATSRGRGPDALTSVPWGDGATATAVGIYLHAAMEAHLQELPFDRAQRWRELAPIAARTGALVHVVDRVLSRALADRLWPTLLAEALAVESELPLVHQADPATLVRGTLDLLVELPGQRLLVIDFKATRLADAEQATDEELRRFAYGRGWHEQLEAYAAALRLLYPGHMVEVAVYFLSLARLVKLPGH